MLNVILKTKFQQPCTPFNIMTDLIIGGLLILAFIRGWMKGLLRTLLGPFSFIIGCFFSYVYYLQSKNLLVAVALSVVLPFLLEFILATLLSFFKKNDDKKNDHTAPLFTVNQVLGGLVAVIWFWIIAALTLICIALVPANFPGVSKIQKDALTSRSYGVVRNIVGDKLSRSTDDIQHLAETLADPSKMQAIGSTPEFEELIEDEKLKAIFNDEETVKQIQEKNISKLLVNPKIHNLLRDPQLVRKLLSLSKQVIDQPKPSKE